MDAIELLKSDHQQVKQLLKKFKEAPDGQPEEKRRLAEQIVREMLVHERIEEEIFYPAFKEAADKEGRSLVNEGKEEHRVVDLIIEELQGLKPDDPQFEAKVKVMGENIEHHIEEEEEEMFPKAREALGKEKLQQLGRDMQDLKTSLQAQLDQKQNTGQGQTQQWQQAGQGGQR